MGFGTCHANERRAPVALRRLLDRQRQRPAVTLHFREITALDDKRKFADYFKTPAILARRFGSYGAAAVDEILADAGRDAMRVVQEHRGLRCERLAHVLLHAPAKFAADRAALERFLQRSDRADV